MSDGSACAPGHDGDSRNIVLEVDSMTLARVIREQGVVALSQAETEALARSVEDSKSDEELLANALAAVRCLIDALEPGVGANQCRSSGEGHATPD